MAEFETRTTDAHGRPVTIDGRPTFAQSPVVERTVVRERSNSLGWLIALLLIVGLVIAAFAFKLINIDQLTNGSAPKVSVSGGELPKFKVDTAKIDVGTKTTEIRTPTVDVGTKKTEIATPTLHVEKADTAKP